MTNRVVRAISRAALPSVLLVVAALASSASAANRQRLRVAIRPVVGQADRGSRPVGLHFTLSRWTDEGALSSPASDDRFYLAPGYALHPAAVPYCSLTALTERGPAACRRARIGSGTLRVTLSGKRPLPADGTVTVYNTPPVHRRPTTLTYVFVPRPVRSEFWFQAALSPTRRGSVMEVRETRLSLFGLPLTVVGLDFDLERNAGHGSHRRSYVTGPARCGPPGSRTFGLRTTFYDRLINSSLDRPAGPPLFTAEPASCR